MTTDTPRTDAEAESTDLGLYVYADFARQLERELSALEAEGQHFRENQNTFTIALCEESEQRATKAEAEVERLRARLRKAIEIAVNLAYDYADTEYDDDLDQLKATLNPTNK